MRRAGQSHGGSTSAAGGVPTSQASLVGRGRVQKLVADLGHRHVGGPDERRVVPVDHGEDRLGILPPRPASLEPDGQLGVVETLWRAGPIHLLRVRDPDSPRV